MGSVISTRPKALLDKLEKLDDGYQVYEDDDLKARPIMSEWPSSSCLTPWLGDGLTIQGGDDPPRSFVAITPAVPFELRATSEGILVTFVLNTLSS